MSTAGRIFAGAVRGVSKYGLDQLDEREEEERDVRKAKLLEDLRMSTAKELATFEYGLKGKQADKDFSSADENDYVMRNSEGKEVGRRALTSEEKRQRQLDLDQEQAKLDNERDQIRSRRVGDAREERYTSASIANMGKTGRKGLDEDEEDVSPNSFAQGIVNRYKGFLGADADKIDEQVAFELAQEAMDYAASTNGNTQAAEDYYLRKLKLLKGGNAAPSGGKVRIIE